MPFAVGLTKEAVEDLQRLEDLVNELDLGMKTGNSLQEPGMRSAVSSESLSAIDPTVATPLTIGSSGNKSRLLGRLVTWPAFESSTTMRSLPQRFATSAKTTITSARGTEHPNRSGALCSG